MSKRAKFPYKTTLSKAIVKIYRMRSTNWTYHKELSFATFIFQKLKKSRRTSYEKLIQCTNYPNAHIHIIRKDLSVFDGVFSL